MALGAIHAAALQGPTPRYSLTVDGQDMIPYVPLDGVSVDHAVVGAVSVMRFTIEDPGAAVTVQEGDVVRFADTRGEPQFWGFISDLSIAPMAVGRAYAVTAQGQERLLDILVTQSSLSWPTGALRFLYAIVQQLLSDARPTTFPNLATSTYGQFPVELTWGHSNSASSTASTPLSDLNAGALLPGSPTLTIAAGTTLRAAFRQAVAACVATGIDPGRTWFTVDPLLAFRGWSEFETLDYGAPVVVDTAASPLRATNPVLRSEAPQPNAPVTYTGDKTGAMTLADVTPPANLVWPGSHVDYTAANLGLGGSTSFVIGSIRKTYHGTGRQTWRIEFGNTNRSYVDSV